MQSTAIGMTGILFFTKAGRNETLLHSTFTGALRCKDADP